MNKREKEKYYFFWQTIIDKAQSIPLECMVCGKIRERCLCKYDIPILDIPISEIYLKDKFYDESIDWNDYAEAQENNL